MKIQNFKVAAPIFLLSSVVALSCMHKSKPQQEIEFSKWQNQWREIVPLSERNPSSAAEVPSWAANEQQVQKAVCRNELPKTAREIQLHIQRKKWLDGVEPADFKVSGIELKSERPELVHAFARLLTPVNANEEIKGLPESFQKTFKVNPSCQKVFCAVQKIFGPEVGPQMLFLMSRFGVNTSPYSFVNASVFRPDEIYDVLKTFELLGTETPFIENQKLIKFKRGYTRAMYGADGNSVLANAGIELFDGWSEKSSLTRQYALYHEFAHNYSNAHFQDYDSSQSWLKLSGWAGDGRDFKTSIALTLKGHPFESRYGAENPFEDFAESLTAYRLNPDHLKRTSEKKYQFIRHLVHDGQEFTTSTCQKSSRFDFL
ncbi:MAG: hypothetical protein ACK5P6_09275 [Pseudobdellovibrionaceae bacterium]